MLVGVVDDDVRMLEAIGELLAASGYEACLFESAEAFLQSDLGEGVSCVISDFGMPGMSGVELVSELKVRNRNLPVILMTGRKLTDVQRICDKAGAFAIIAKPFEPSEALALLRSATSKHNS
jgi:FixJ family two-component response regulator